MTVDLAGFDNDLDGTCILASLTDTATRALADARHWHNYDVERDDEGLRCDAAAVVEQLIETGVIRRVDFTYDDTTQRWARADA